MALRASDSGYILLANALKHPAGKIAIGLDAYNEALKINPESSEAQTAINSLRH